ncbi:hypothetical protein [Limisalsivibrio acetivorans]|uniref:hypothetical protein n=1 Tax=Limisalsivibrio acetivorans TaxID=1304888 RepID=UPI0003B73AC8|nr:hypothetical protein [Limisalsivibrio acetivorans]
MIEWITCNPDAVSAIAAIITAVATIFLFLCTGVYVFLTNQSVKEARKLRETATSPLISIYIQSFKKSQYLELVIENIGNSPAYNIDIKFDENFIQKVHETENRIPFELHIKYFTPKQSVAYFLCEFGKLPQDNDFSFNIDLSYSSKDKEVFNDSFKYNYSFLKRADNSIPYELEQHKNMLRGIENSIKGLTSAINKKANP